MADPLAIHGFTRTDIAAALEFLKRTRSELREIRKIHVYRDRFQIIDVNADCFEMRGVGYLDGDIVPLLRLLNTAFDPATIHAPVDAEFKEFGAGRRHTWAEDRLM